MSVLQHTIDVAVTLVRVLFGFGIFLFAGIFALADFETFTDLFIESMPLFSSMPTLFAFAAIVIQVVGGLALALGWRVRAAGILLFLLVLCGILSAGTLSVAPIRDTAVILVLAAFVAFGAGKYSVSNYTPHATRSPNRIRRRQIQHI